VIPAGCRTSFEPDPAVVEKLDAALTRSAPSIPGYEIAVTGLSAIACAQQRHNIEKLNRRADDRVCTGGDLYRAGIPLGGCDVVVHPAGYLPGGVVGHGAVVARGGLQFASVVALTVRLDWD